MSGAQDGYAVTSMALLGLAVFGFFVFVIIVDPPRPQRVKPSAVFIKTRYSAESPLADALSTKYRVGINPDTLLSSYSYQPPSRKSSALIATPTPDHARKIRIGSAIFIAGYGLNSVILGCRAFKRYAIGDSSFIDEAVSCFSALSNVVVFVIMYISIRRNLLKRNDTGGATVFCGTELENWITSHDVTVFSTSERMEVAIKRVAILLCRAIASIACLCSTILVCVDILAMIFDKGEPGLAIGSLIYDLVTATLAGVAFVKIATRTIWMIRRSVSTVEVQLAQPASEKDEESTDVFKLDVDKVVKKFANDIVMNGNTHIASAGAYCDFVITAPEGGLVYGRLRAKGTSENV
ncbi:hypothetical protein V1517DRAFT_328903 [Lipomyces orientalis]|uniref:Uncharacterized protein n=1 Tax=Lipomyces orientalis TaxID=1233043 RepID=A0ACC3TIC5_9ASCO